MLRADLHIHTTLSPCGDLEMSPVNILRAAREKQLHIIGITDHNSTRQASLIRELGAEQGIFVLTGAEVTTREEIHCLAFLPDDGRLSRFQAYLDDHLPPLPNKPEKFGFQVVVDAEEHILYEEEKTLLSAIDQSMEEVEQEVHRLEGIFIPAHIDKKRFSVLSQLGFVPAGLRCEALELSAHTTPDDFLLQHPYLKDHRFTRASDAHYPQDIGKFFIEFPAEQPDFFRIREALREGLFR
ncbi:MAG: PHP domain-containing protein [Culturomica sp.]|jgi:PHP family Zn ribbon phosphoesterase|nr:PHP domain-containing protein [Culturomica sp.]